MAGVADKARFYLERAVPQLREFEEKEIFTKEEIRTLVQKRTEHEHLILSPGSKPSDFLAYASWEQSLDGLRAKRCRRLKIRTPSATSAHASQARTFGIFDRAVMRHPGSVPLWQAYLAFADKAGATRRWRKVATRALRMHPRDEGLWVLAGRRAAMNGDMEGARSLFMRGCRFCMRGERVWVEYARCEMEWLARMEKKKGAGKNARGVKALEEVRAAEAADEGDEIRFDENDDGDEDIGEDGQLILPDPDAEAKNEKREVFSEEAVQKLERSPALDGAIPLAIFNISKKQPFFGAAAAEAFYNMFSAYTSVPSQPRIVQNVLDSMTELYPNHASTCSCLIRQPLVGVDTRTAAFPQALRESLARLKTYMERTDNKKDLAAKTIAWIDSFLAIDDLDGGIRTVLDHIKRKLETP